MFRIFVLSLSTLFAVLMFNASAGAQLTIPGQVIDVIDGKTVLVALASGKVKVELQYIDVPERGQELHDTIREHLRSLVVGKVVEYRPKELFTDRATGRLTVKNVDVSQQMLRDGAAWHLPSQVSGQEKAEYDAYSSLEAAAKSEKIGVWSIPGLRPAWEFRAELKEKAWQQEQSKSAKSPPTEAEPSRKLGARPRGNPALGNVGALVNEYDPESRTGYLGTSFLGVKELDKTLETEQRTLVDVSYFYKQEDGNKKKGTYVFSMISASKKWRFLTNNNLIFTANGKDTVIGKAKRTSFIDGDEMREKLVYEISRPALERIVNDDEILLKVGGHLIEPSPGLKYILYNLLQVTQ